MRPIIGNLRFDDDRVLIVTRMPKAVLQETALGQSTDQQIDFLFDRVAVRRKRAEWQTGAQILRPICCAGAELSQADRMAIEARDDISVRERFERDVRAQPGGNDRWRDPPPFLFFGSAHAGMTLRCGGETE